MGIRGLLSEIKLHSKDMVNLVSEAKSKNGIKILIDFHAFLRAIIELITKNIFKTSDKNKFIYYLSAEYDILMNTICEFHKSFYDAGITLIWIIDGPKGLDKIAEDHRMETWIKRDDEDINYINNMLNDCKIKEVPFKKYNIDFMLNFEVAISGLKKADAQIIQLLKGDCNEYIANELLLGNAYATITNDTDLLVFGDFNVIFCQHIFSKQWEPVIDENLENIFKKPERFICPVITQKRVLQILEFSDQSQLVALSILRSSDNTEIFVDELNVKLGITRFVYKKPNLEQVARYIKRHDINMENIFEQAAIKKFLEENPKFSEAVKFRVDFYTLTNFKRNFENGQVLYVDTMDDGSLSGFFRKQVSNLEISKALYSIHCGLYQGSISIEKPNSTCFLISILKYIRERIYAYVLDNEKSEVIEWNNRNSPKKVTVPVTHESLKTNKIIGKRSTDSGTPHGDSVIYGTDLFEEIWSHLEDKHLNPLNYFRSFGIEKGFICYLLRYFYKTTKGVNLELTEDEFKALFVTVFYQYAISQKPSLTTDLNKKTFLSMRICPTGNCLHIFSWFTGIHFYGKHLSGGAFNLSNDFPSLDQLMSATVLFAFYEHAMNETNKRASHLSNSIVDALVSAKNKILDLYSSEYQEVTK